MLKEFRYTGNNPAGKPVQGVVLAHNKSTAKKLIHDIETKKVFLLIKLIKKLISYIK